MYEFIIKNYIDNLTIDQVINYAKKENIKLTIEEANIIYDYAKKYWLVFYKGNPTNLFNKLQKLLSKSTYDTIINLYKKYKKIS